MFGGDTLFELRVALQQAEQQLEGVGSSLESDLAHSLCVLSQTEDRWYLLNAVFDRLYIFKKVKLQNIIIY